MFKRLLCILFALMTVTMLIIAAVAAGNSGYVRGDADGDGKVTILDATAVQRVLAALPVESFDEKAADVNGDGLNILDATKIQRYLAGFSDAAGIGAEVTEQPTKDPYELPFVPC